MNLARVVGRVVSTHKDQGLSGRKLLMLIHIDQEQRESGAPFVAVDAVGAGAAELVIFVKGREAAHAFGNDQVPTDASVVGIVDQVARGR